jgi:PleD family two-component response regulator
MQQFVRTLILASHPGDNVLDRFFEAGGTAAVFTVMVIAAIVAHRRANRQLRQARADRMSEVRPPRRA